MSTSVSDDNLEKKFQAVTNTQDSIQTLSLWILHHKAHHQKIVKSWMKVLKKTKISHRLTLFYLANDVVQNGKRKGFLQFGNSFAEVLREATLLVRDEQIRPSIQRVFTIWEQRNIYTPEYIADLRAILANTKVPATAHSKLLAEFKPDTVIDRLRVVMQLEMEVESKMSTINLSKLNATNAEIVQQLKDRTHGQQFKREFDESTRCLEELIKTLNKEVKERTELILLLEQSEIYYDTQRGEAKIVANAYKNFGTRVKTLQKKLEELTTTFPSPVPSPCPDAPSPTNSDLEMELSLPNDGKAQTNELENVENAPSPVGTPEGLNLSPVTQPVETESEPISTQSVGNPIPTLSNFFSHAVLVRTTEGLNLSAAAKPVETKTQPVSTQSIGNPIPTLSNFFSNEQSGMTSWLDTFASKKKPFNKVSEKNEVPTSDSSSLDSRLSTLLQNIPNLPSSLQSTIFGNASSGNNTPLHDSVNSPLTSKKDTDSITPSKDEYSGQNTPLQDEESTHSSHAFFSKITSSSKSKDILTSLIQSVSTEKSDDSQKKDKFGFGNIEPFDQGGMSSFIKKIIPSVSAPRSSPSFYNSTQPTLSSVQTVPIAQTSTINSYETACFQDVPVYSSKPSNNQTEQLSFIPSLVPSMPQENFSYEGYSPNEYNPELETFDTEIDVENALGDVLSEQSPALESLSPVASPSEDDIPRSLGSRGLSTLITVVTKDSPDNSLPPPEYSSKDTFKSDKENVTQEPQWNNDDLPKNNDIWTKNVVPQESIGNSSPNEEFFIGKEAATLPPPFYTSMPPPIIDHHHKSPSSQNVNYFNPVNNVPTDLPLSKIETVQSQRDEMNGRWYGNNYPENDRRPPPLLPRGPPPMPCSMQETRFFDKRNFPLPPPFRPRNNWAPRHRPEHFHHPYGPPPQMKRFPFRGRGRGRPYPQY